MASPPSPRIIRCVPRLQLARTVAASAAAASIRRRIRPLLLIWPPTAREAVVGFLHDSSMGGLADETTQPTGGIRTAKAGPSTVAVKAATNDASRRLLHGNIRVRMPAERASVPSGTNAESVAVRAAATGIATLDRIEAAAAKVEADIRSALRAQAELQAGAGAAAEAAVRAAEKSWIAAHTAEAAEGRARIILGLMTRYLAVTIALVVITIIFLIITASTAH